MKAVLALIVLYVGMFLIAIQGGNPSSVQAAPQGSSAKISVSTGTLPVDPAKDADIRALLDLVGARDEVEDSVKQSSEQYREKLLVSVPDSERGRAFVNTAITEFEKKYDAERVNNQLVVLYDKHYSDDEIKGLLQFYGSPLGQKVALESPKIFREIQETTRSEAGKAVKDALQQATQEYPGIGQNARLGNNVSRPLQQHRTPQTDASEQSAQQIDPQQ